MGGQRPDSGRTALSRDSYIIVIRGIRVNESAGMPEGNLRLVLQMQYKLTKQKKEFTMQM